MLESLTDRLFVLFQRLLPDRSLGRFAHWLARRETPWLRRLLIAAFTRVYRIDVDEAERPAAGDWAHLNAFFTRSLKPGARPVAPEPDAFVSPCDGTVEQLGRAQDDFLVQAKNFRYRICDLLAEDPAAVRHFSDGVTTTIYLAPPDYHRIHFPCDARVRAVSFVPGHRWAVNRRTVRAVPGLLAANERVVVQCESPGGRFAVVLVGALNVASISLAWCGEIRPGPAITRHGLCPPDDTPFRKGDLLGQFNLGSTVVIVAERRLVQWIPDIALGARVRMGERIGHLGGH